MDLLVVDDEPMVGRIFAQRLRREIAEGLVLHFATSGDEALRILAERPSRLVLILSDINMPGMSGLELLDRLRRQNSPARVYMVSAYDDDDYRQKALSLGAAGFFPKPMDFEILKKLLRDGASWA